MLTQLASLRQTVSCTYVLNPRRENAGIPSSCAPCAESVSRSSLRLCQAFGTVQTVFLQPLTFLKSNDTNAWFCPAADAGCRLGFGCGSPDRTPAILEHKRQRGCACGLRRGGLSQVGKGDDGVSGVHGGVDAGVFLFANKAHLKAFLKDSRKYAPHSLGLLQLRGRTRLHRPG